MIEFKSYPVYQFDFRDINSPFGMRMHPIYKVMKLHEGIDYRAPLGTPVFAVADGKVVISKMQGNRKGYGEYIVLEHSGFETLYAHLSKRIVQIESKVRAGQIIGYVGTTGDSSGYHLHFGLCKRFSNKDWEDPMKYLLALKGDEEVVDKGKFIINGNEKELDRILKDGINYVELRDVTSALGFAVEYNKEKKMPVISKK